VEVRFTPSARACFLEAVVRLRDRDCATALNFVDRVERTLRRLGDEPDLGSEVRMTREMPDLPENHRFYYRVRAATVWILAVWAAPCGASSGPSRRPDEEVNAKPQRRKDAKTREN